MCSRLRLGVGDSVAERPTALQQKPHDCRAGPHAKQVLTKVGMEVTALARLCSRR
jgi:hypothetical protein